MPQIAKLSRIGDVRTVLATGLPPGVVFVEPGDGVTVGQCDNIVCCAYD